MPVVVHFRLNDAPFWAGHSSKENAIRRLTGEYGCPPLLGFGDSSSDLPLLRAARHAVCINREGAFKDLTNAVYLPPTASSEEILRKVRGVCRA